MRSVHANFIRRLAKLAAMVLLGVVTLAQAADAGGEVVGAGASFPAPAMQAWARQYAGQSGTRLSYRSVGSSEGIRRVTARSVDFGVTDVPLTQAELANDDLLQFPIIAGAIVPVVNLPGIGDAQLTLSGAVLSDILMGKITRWNAKAITALNPERELPDLPITVVHRSDGSGTTFVFTYYLSRISPEWQDRYGIASRLHWPVGIGAKGNEGIAEAVRDTAGALGYVELAYAATQNLATVRLPNRSGRIVRAGAIGVRTALASANWSRPGFYEVLVDRDGEDSWPIVGISFALIHKMQEDGSDALATLKFLHWIYAHGVDALQGLHYSGLEDARLIEQIESSWTQIRDRNDRVVWKGQP